MKSITLLAVLGLGVSVVLGRAVLAPNPQVVVEESNGKVGYYDKREVEARDVDTEDCGGCDFYVKRDVDTTSTAEWGEDLTGFFKRDVDTTSTAEWGEDLTGFFKRDSEATTYTNEEECGGCDFYVKRDVDTTSTAEWGEDLTGFFKRADGTTTYTDGEECGGCDFYVKRDLSVILKRAEATTDEEDCGGCDFYV